MKEWLHDTQAMPSRERSNACLLIRYPT